ncbi:MAG: Serine/threonine protein phosphatase [uncultured Sphingomonadaceae bacterium]|uniref:Serine/threonine protein phosphatase n=1 Tax=uncultured Sphingomonadaceae bacterium TaxID=169976 RepID=A0A6J4U3X8_9SPHN|nr:MAG: Serine/threonine protein phosphatase [uncultured Sphingomonadaceae bacterium]
MLSLFKRRSTPAKTISGPPGARAYAIGDVHGQLDLLDRLLARIEEDQRDRPAAKTFVVLLGDTIDRGPDSCGVIERLRTYKPAWGRPVFLMGNHEEFFLRILDGDVDLVGSWLTYGGRELALSYGISDGWLLNATSQAVVQELYRRVPAAHREFVKSFNDSFRFGDYLFVHAGIKPGVAIEDQVPGNLRWIREGFLEDRTDHGVVVVHGHTIVEVPDERPNRIGIDTGAYKGGPLTAIALEGADRWFLAAGE